MEQLELFDTPPQPEPVQRIGKLTHFAVIEKSNSVEAIWGVGRSRKAAMDDAVKAFRDGWHNEYGIRTRKHLEEALTDGELIITRCTRRLARNVLKYGGEIAFNYSPENGACLPGDLGV